jgi:phage gpG-like protein
VAAGGFHVEVEVHGLEAAQRIAQRVQTLGGDQQPLLAIAGSILEASTLRRFESESGPGGVPWPKSKAALGLVPRASGRISPGRTLFDTGGLEGSVRHEVRAGEVEVGVDARTESATHAAAHQFGSHRQTVVVGHTRLITQAFGVPIAAREVQVRPHGRVTNLPARPFIGVDNQDREDLTDAWLDYLRSQFNVS